MRIISLSPPLIIPGLVLLGSEAIRAVTHGSWPTPSIADALTYLGFALSDTAAWLNLSLGWVFLLVGLFVGEVGLVQARAIAAKEKKMMARMKVEAEERRASERHADMVQRRSRRLHHILNRAA